VTAGLTELGDYIGRREPGRIFRKELRIHPDPGPDPGSGGTLVTDPIRGMRIDPAHAAEVIDGQKPIPFLILPPSSMDRS